MGREPRWYLGKAERSAYALLSIALACGCATGADEANSKDTEDLARSTEELVRRLQPPDEEALGHIEQAKTDGEFLKKAGEHAAEFGRTRGRTGLVTLYPDGRLTATAYDEGVAEVIAARTAKVTSSGEMLADGSPDGDEPQDVLVDKEMSGGVDNRTYLGSPTYSYWEKARSRIGSISGALPDHHCSGTLIGNRLVFTAAHCVGITASGALSGKGWFTPQQQGSSGTPPGFGTWAPYGSAEFNAISYPSMWFTLGCHNNALASNCWKYDFAVAILNSNPFNTWMGHPGYTAFGYFSETSIKNAYIRNIGYPSCSPSSPPAQVPPANCKAHQPYGDVSDNCGGLTPTFSGASASNGWPWSSTDNPAVQTGCDVSSGHSGSPMYTYSSPCGSPGPCVFANVYSGWPAPYGAQGVKINEKMFNWLLSLRTLYP